MILKTKVFITFYQSFSQELHDREDLPILGVDDWGQQDVVLTLKNYGCKQGQGQRQNMG